MPDPDTRVHEDRHPPCYFKIGGLQRSKGSVEGCTPPPGRAKMCWFVAMHARIHTCFLTYGYRIPVSGRSSRTLFQRETSPGHPLVLGGAEPRNSCGEVLIRRSAAPLYCTSLSFACAPLTIPGVHPLGRALSCFCPARLRMFIGSHMTGNGPP